MLRAQSATKKAKISSTTHVQMLQGLHGKQHQQQRSPVPELRPWIPRETRSRVSGFAWCAADLSGGTPPTLHLWENRYCMSSRSWPNLISK